MSLAGLPPLSGFFAKLSLVQAGLAVNHFGIVAVALFVSLLTLYSMTKIWTLGFWKPDPETEEVVAPNGATSGESSAPKAAEVGIVVSPSAERQWALWYLPIILLALVMLAISFGAGATIPLALEAGQQLMNPAGYIQAVFGSGQ
jgi:multicomponent Na+:H+ antiporter subunit D